MDRFIETEKNTDEIIQINLKSNMDRFIVPTFPTALPPPLLFKIQYG